MRQREHFCGILLVLVSISVAIACVHAGCGIAFAAEDDHESWYSQFGANLLTGSNAGFLDLSESPGLIGGLSVSGFYNNSTGMWANSSALH
jgi:hypothetical protein